MKPRYTEEQIIRILKEVESGTTVASVSRKYGVSEATVYRWRHAEGGIAAWNNHSYGAYTKCPEQREKN